MTAPGERSAGLAGTGDRRTIALIGDPVVHSVSPDMQRAAFRDTGLPLDYVARRVTTGELPAVFAELRRTCLGLNVTAPVKEAVIPLLDECTPEAEAAGSVNTVTFDGAGHAAGTSTDGPGFLAALDRAAASAPRRAVILGRGGAAQAVKAALLTRGADEIRCFGRDAAPEAIASALAGADLLVNATPVGTWPAVDATPLPDGLPLGPGLVVFDLVYRPRRTALLTRAEASGCPTVEGIEMLIEQGARSFERWTGLRAPVESMRAAAYRALAMPPKEEARCAS